MDKPESVRIAGPNDERGLYELLMDLWETNGQGWGFSLDPALLIRHIQQGTRPNVALRADPSDLRRAIHGVIDDPIVPGRLIGSVGMFLDQAMWFTREMAATELWLYVRWENRNERRYEQALRDFSFYIHQELRKNTQERMPLITGFMHRDDRFPAMERLWQRLWGPRAKKVAIMYWID